LPLFPFCLPLGFAEEKRLKTRKVYGDAKTALHPRVVCNYAPCFEKSFLKMGTKNAGGFMT
jgi:hypothetical protein